MEYKKLEFTPQLNACDFPHEVDEELAENDITTHYQADSFYIDWDDKEDFPITKKWLLETYGESIKSYDYFNISPT